MDLFAHDMPFWKGNLHCHTTESDGALSPEEVKALYRGMGYDFLALTDHRKMTEDTHMEDGMLMLSGLEMDFMLPAEALHIVGIGMDRSILQHRLDSSPQSCIDAFQQCGGRAIVAHPAWSLNTVATLSGLHRVTAAEIYNSTSTYPWNGDRADSSHVLDVAAAHGTFFRFVASDDSHQYNGDAGRSFTMIQAPSLTWPHLLEALDAGRFYCSQGPRFEQISLQDGVVRVSCSPVKYIIYYSNALWTENRCQTGSGLTQGEYTIGKEDTYVRIQLIDEQGCSAWCNPILL